MRASRGMTQELLGRSLMPPMTRASVANIESGKQRILLHTLLQISGVLNVPINEFISAQADPAQNQNSGSDLEHELAKELDVPKRVLKRLANKFVEAQNRNS